MTITCRSKGFQFWTTTKWHNNSEAGVWQVNSFISLVIRHTYPMFVWHISIFCRHQLFVNHVKRTCSWYESQLYCFQVILHEWLDQQFWCEIFVIFCTFSCNFSAISQASCIFKKNFCILMAWWVFNVWFAIKLLMLHAIFAMRNDIQFQYLDN